MIDTTSLWQFLVLQQLQSGETLELYVNTVVDCPLSYIRGAGRLITSRMCCASCTGFLSGDESNAKLHVMVHQLLAFWRVTGIFS